MTEQKQEKQSLDQRRAKHALKCVKKIKSELESQQQSLYMSYAKALPATILQNGLGQAMATLRAKGEDKNDPYRRLYEDVQSWLCGGDQESPFPKQTDLLEAIISNGQQDYLKAQAEAQVYLVWLKKFAAAFLNEKPHENCHANPPAL